MAYLGQSLPYYDPTNAPVPQLDAERFNGNGSITAFTMARQVTTNTDVDVFVDNVRQEPVTAYQVANKTLTFTEAPPSATGNIYIIYRNSYGNQTFATLPDGAITFAKLANNIKQFTVETFTGDGSTTAFVCAETPANANSLIVSIDGVIQNATTNFALATKTITFTSAPANAAAIVVKFLGFRTDVAVSALAAGTVTTAALADNSVTAAKIAPGTIVDSDIADNAVTTAKILNANVTEAKLAANAVTTSKVGDNTVTTAKIANDAVTVAKVNLISTSSVPSLEAKGTSGSTSGYIQLNCSENSHGIKLLGPPHSAAADYTLTLPNNDGDANQFLQTNGSGVTSWATVSSSPTFLQISKTVTGAVTALRGVSNAATTGNVGAYPVGNTLGSTTNTTMAGLVQNNGTGKTAIKAAGGGRNAANTGKADLFVYGQYLNSSNVWVNNGTVLTLTSPNEIGSGASYEIDNGTAFIWRTPDGKFQVANLARGNSGAPSTATVILYTIVVNESTGAPTQFGTARQAIFGVGVGTGSAGTSSAFGITYGEDRFIGRLQANTYGYFEFYYDPSSGWQAPTTSDATKTAYVYDYAMNTTSNNALSVNPYAKKSGLENAAGNRFIQVAPNGLRAITIASHVIQTATPTNVTLSSDYASDGQTSMLDSTHCIQIYVANDGNRKIKTFTIAADGASVTLIDTFILPSGTESTKHFVFKDTKNFVLHNGPDANGIINSVGLDTDFSILGTNIKTSSIAPVQINYSGSGNVFNVWNLLLGLYGFRTYTVNAYSTPPFNYGGVAASSASSGTVNVYVSGVVPGYTGMTVDSTFYINNTFDGTFTNDSTLGTPRVGKAISQTEILLGAVE